MPRLAPSFFRKAHRISHNLIPLLRTCRDLESACNELRWLREHVAAQPTRNHEQRLRKLCADRGRGKPLQYILGTEFFGELELLCRPGVLIPRCVLSSSTYPPRNANNRGQQRNGALGGIPCRPPTL